MFSPMLAAGRPSLGFRPGTALHLSCRQGQAKLTHTIMVLHKSGPDELAMVLESKVGAVAGRAGLDNWHVHRKHD
eukprot:988198-Amphidinium_carterae.1